MSTKPFFQGFKQQPVKVETTAGDRLVRRLSAKETLAFSEYSQRDDVKSIDVMTELVLVAAANEDGTRALGDEDRQALLEIPFVDLKALFDAAATLNKISKDGADTAEKD